MIEEFKQLFMQGYESSTNWQSSFWWVAPLLAPQVYLSTLFLRLLPMSSRD